MNDTTSILQLAYEMGETLLANGAEISRVQETMERVAKAYQIETFHVYVLTNAIFANGTENGITSATKLTHVPSTSIHLGRISSLNQLSREISAGQHTVEEAFAILEKIKVQPYSRLWLATIACGIGSAAFSYLFGGSLWDSSIALACGLALEPFLFFCDKYKMTKFLRNLLASAFVTLCGAFFFTLGLGDNMDKIIIGAIIRLVPGVALTTSIRDFFNGDYLSGTIRLIDAFLIGLCIAVGVGVVVRLFSVVTGGAFL